MQTNPISDAIVALSMFTLVFIAAQQRFGTLNAAAICAAIWLLAPYKPRS